MKRGEGTLNWQIYATWIGVSGRSVPSSSPSPTSSSLVACLWLGICCCPCPFFGPRLLPLLPLAAVVNWLLYLYKLECWLMCRFNGGTSADSSSEGLSDNAPVDEGIIELCDTPMLLLGFEMLFDRLHLARRFWNHVLTWGKINFELKTKSHPSLQFLPPHLSVAQFQLNGQVPSVFGWKVLVVSKPPFQTLRLLWGESHLAAFSLRSAWGQQISSVGMSPSTQRPQARRGNCNESIWVLFSEKHSGAAVIGSKCASANDQMPIDRQ